MNMILPLALLTSLLAVSPVFAQQAGDTIVNLGVAYIVPNASASTPVSTGTPAAATFNGLLAGTDASIANETTASLSVLQMLTNNVAAELSVGVPPTLKVSLNLPNGTIPQSHPDAAQAKALTPALVGKYLFNTPQDPFRPYLGLGVTYASFRDVSINTSDPTLVTVAGTSAKLRSSWAPVYNLGVIYNIDKKWSINASVSYIPLESEITLLGGASSPGAGLTTKSTLTINPTDYVVRIGYKF